LLLIKDISTFESSLPAKFAPKIAGNWDSGGPDFKISKVPLGTAPAFGAEHGGNMLPERRLQAKCAPEMQKMKSFKGSRF